MDLRGVDFSGFKKLIEADGGNIVILTHRNPDGDAVGASLSLYLMLKKLGHQVDVVVPNPLPKFLRWMKGAKDIIIHSNTEARAERIISEATLIIAVDFNDLSRIREYEEKVRQNSCFKVLIDHHPNPGNFADLTISEVGASSTAELVYHVAHQMKLDNLLDADIATCIYTGIMTDTGNFNFNSSRPDTFTTVAALLEHGIEKDQVFDQVFDNFSHNRMRLMGYSLDKKMVVLPEFKTAYIALTQKELKEYDFKIGDSEGFVNLPLSIAGVRFSVLFIENKDRVKLSFRSKGLFAVNGMAAEYFNGGGHRNASGGESFDSLDDTINKFVSILPQYKDELLSE